MTKEPLPGAIMTQAEAGIIMFETQVSVKKVLEKCTPLPYRGPFVTDQEVNL